MKRTLIAVSLGALLTVGVAAETTDEYRTRSERCDQEARDLLITDTGSLGEHYHACMHKSAPPEALAEETERERVKVEAERQKTQREKTIIAAYEKNCKANPKGCMVDTGLAALRYCQLITSLKLELRRINGSERLDFACVAESEAKISPLYAAAIKRTPKSGSAVIKDFYAQWLAAIRGVAPEPAEIVVGYKTRQATAAAALAAKGERLKLD